jgi:hypothetical protein
VTDFNPWAVNEQFLSVTNSFTVVVRPIPSPPVILSFSVSNGAAIVTWRASAGSTYRLQYVGSLTETNWTEGSADIVADGPIASSCDSPGLAPQRFYRVVQVIPW